MNVEDPKSGRAYTEGGTLTQAGHNAVTNACRAAVIQA